MMRHDNMDISRLMVHAQQVEETRLKRNNKEFKRLKSCEGGTSKGRIEIQDKCRLNKRVSNKVHSIFSKANKDKLSSPKFQKTRIGSSPRMKQTCSQCGKEHWGECLVGKENRFACGKSDHKVRYLCNV